MIQLIAPEKIYALRNRILRPGFPESVVHYPNDFDEGAFHVARFFEGEVASCATFFPASHEMVTSKNPYRLRGMATDDRLSGRGFGKEVLKFGLTELKKRGADFVWFDARVGALSFYLNNDCHIVTPIPYLVPKICLHYLLGKEV